MYLTELKLGEILKDIFPDEIIINNKKIIGYKELCRPDYQIPNKKLIFEFDGPTHYTSPKRILKDIENDKFYNSIGFTVIRIPYFIQIDKDFYSNILNIDRESLYNFPNGFISDVIVLPAEYCYAGINKFLNDLERFKYASNDIINSLADKCNELQIELVLPEILEYLIKESK